MKSISIDPSEGKVTVAGNVHPMVLVKLLQKMGKKAKLWSFDQGPMQKRSGSSHSKQKDTSHGCCEGCHSENDSDTDSDHDCVHRTRHGHKSKKKHSHKHSFGYEHAAPPPVQGYHHPPPPPPQVSGYHYPPMPGYPQHQPFSGYHSHPQMQRFPPMSYAGPPPPMYPGSYPGSMPMYGGGYYGRGQPAGPAYGNYGPRQSRPNPMTHYRSYADNYYRY